MPTYTGISSEAFRHPLDREAEAALRSVPGFQLVASKFVEFMYERPQFVFHMGNSIEVGPRQYSTLYRIFRECVRDLDVYPEPSLFVSQNPNINAYSLGKEHPYIVLNTGLIDLLNEAEIRSVIAHELGHIKCGHTILTMMGMWAISLAATIGEMTFGIGNLVSSGLIFAFYEWRRKAELSSDRAALLVMDDLKPVMQTMMKVAGCCQQFGHECSVDEFVKQADKYQNLDEDGLNQIYKFLLYNGAQGLMLSHPFPVERLGYLRSWADSAEYRQIRAGNYKRSGAEGSVEVESHPEGSAPRSNPKPPNSDAEELRRQIQELQQEIDRIKNSK